MIKHSYLIILFLLIQSLSASVIRGPYLSSVTHSSIVITWTTAMPSMGAVRYAEEGNPEIEITASGNSLFHTVTLWNLKPATRYFYSIHEKDTVTAKHAFNTASLPGAPITFAVYGDTRSNREAHVSVLRAMKKENPLFIINSGDLVAKNSAELWDYYFTDLCSVTGIGPSVPTYASPGNHEVGAMYYENLVLPRNPHDSTESFYSFDYGDVHFIAANSQIDYQPGSLQYNWIRKDLESPEAKSAQFRIAFWHSPPYSSSNHGSNMKIREALCPLMEEFNVDIVFNGHDHTYERTKSINGTTYIVTGGGGAPLYDFKTENEWTAYKEKTYHFCKLTVAQGALQLFMIRPDGTTGDAFTIKR